MLVCLKCKAVLVRYYHPTITEEDIWVCPECREIYKKGNPADIEDDIERLRRWI